MKSLAISTAVTALVISAGAEFAPASAQQVVVAPQTYLYAAPPATYYYPTSGFTTVRTYRNRGVLPGFSRRGGIGTTPFLGNTRGLGAYSTNYSAPARTYIIPAYPTQTYVYPARVGGWYR